MYHANAIVAIALAAVFCTANFGAQAFEDSKYPNFQGQWIRAQAPGTADEPRFDPGKPPGRGQQPPLTPEYQAIFEANLREREAGVPGTWPGPSCLPPGMPAQMTAYLPLEPRLAKADRGRLRRLFHRTMDRRGQGRPLRRAGG